MTSDHFIGADALVALERQISAYRTSLVASSPREADATFRLDAHELRGRVTIEAATNGEGPRVGSDARYDKSLRAVRRRLAQEIAR